MSERDEILEQMRGLAERAFALEDPELVAELREMLRRTQAPAPTEDVQAWHGIVGECEQLREMRPHIERFANVDAPVLIGGESGTGKDLIAHALHDLGSRRAKPMVSENCAAIPETLLESVLFGHARGSFTGAVRDHDGHFVAAHGGTLFLDEIGDMPLSMQSKLLRVLQEGEVRPIGGTKTRKVDVRVIAATNQDLEKMVSEGTFREDLFYRLNVLRLELPPLRERGADAVLLARFFLARAADKSGRSLHFSPEAEAAIQAAPWPGNIRQLQNEVQRIVALAEGPLVLPTDLAATA